MRSCLVIDSLRKSDDSLVYSDEDKSELFNKFFTSVFTHEYTNSIRSFHIDRDVPVLCYTIVYNKLYNLKADKPPGPEGWPVLTLRETAQELAVTSTSYLIQQITSVLLSF